MASKSLSSSCSLREKVYIKTQSFQPKMSKFAKGKYNLFPTPPGGNAFKVVKDITELLKKVENYYFTDQ